MTIQGPVKGVSSDLKPSLCERPWAIQRFTECPPNASFTLLYLIVLHFLVFYKYKALFKNLPV